jgi:hypothetical protein
LRLFLYPEVPPESGVSLTLDCHLHVSTGLAYKVCRCSEKINGSFAVLSQDTNARNTTTTSPPSLWPRQFYARETAAPLKHKEPIHHFSPQLWALETLFKDGEILPQGLRKKNGRDYYKILKTKTRKRCKPYSRTMQSIQIYRTMKAPLHYTKLYTFALIGL